MNIAHMKSKAAAAARSTRIAFVRRAVAGGLMGLAVMSSAAVAGPDRGEWQREGAAPQRQYEERQQRQYDDRQQRQAEERYQRMEEQRRQQQAQGQEGRRSGRLTPDERRDLRRQINEAGADIYQRERRR